MDSSLPSLRERNRAETRAQIVQASFSLFLAEGFDEVPVERICERAGVSRATFFNYFSQKEDVLVEIGRQRLAMVEHFVAAQQAWEHPPSLKALLDLFVEMAHENEDAARMGRHVLRRALAIPTVAAQMHALMQSLRSRLIEYLERYAAHRPRPSKFDAVPVAENAIAIYFWTTIEWSLQPEPAAEGELARTLERRMKSLFSPLRQRSPER